MRGEAQGEPATAAGCGGRGLEGGVRQGAVAGAGVGLQRHGEARAGDCDGEVGEGALDLKPGDQGLAEGRLAEIEIAFAGQEPAAGAAQGNGDGVGAVAYGEGERAFAQAGLRGGKAQHEAAGAARRQGGVAGVLQREVAQDGGGKGEGGGAGVAELDLLQLGRQARNGYLRGELDEGGGDEQRSDGGGRGGGRGRSGGAGRLPREDDGKVLVQEQGCCVEGGRGSGGVVDFEGTHGVGLEQRGAVVVHGEGGVGGQARRRVRDGGGGGVGQVEKVGNLGEGAAVGDAEVEDRGGHAERARLQEAGNGQRPAAEAPGEADRGAPGERGCAGEGERDGALAAGGEGVGVGGPAAGARRFRDRVGGGGGGAFRSRCEGLGGAAEVGEAQRAGGWGVGGGDEAEVEFRGVEGEAGARAGAGWQGLGQGGNVGGRGGQAAPRRCW